MKTGMEYPLLGLVLLLAGILAWNAWQATQVDLAVAALSATTAGRELPAEATLAGEWLVKALVSALVGGTVTALVGAGIWWLRRQWKKLQGQPKWNPGPNANWGQQPQPRGPRAMSEAEFYRLLLAQQMAGSGGKAPVALPRLEVEDDEPTFTL